MKTLVAAALAVTIGIAAPASSAFAFGPLHDDRVALQDSRDTRWVGVHDGEHYDACPMSSAAEGNANQQTRPVKQYGQTSGGNRC